MTVSIGHDDSLRLEAIWGEARSHSDGADGQPLRVSLNNMSYPRETLVVEVTVLDLDDPILGHRKVLLLDTPDSQNTVIRGDWGLGSSTSKMNGSSGQD